MDAGILEAMQVHYNVDDEIEIRYNYDFSKESKEDDSAVSIQYQYKDSYVIKLLINKYIGNKNESTTYWIEGDYSYELSVEYLSPEASEVEITQEQLKEFRGIITKKVTDK